MAGDGLCIHMAELLSVITRLCNAFLASLRDSPKPRLDIIYRVPNHKNSLFHIY